MSNRGLRSRPRRHAGAGGASGFASSRRRASICCLLQFSPQYEEMERFAEEVIPHFRYGQPALDGEWYVGRTVRRAD